MPVKYSKRGKGFHDYNRTCQKDRYVIKRRQSDLKESEKRMEREGGIASPAFYERFSLKILYQSYSLFSGIIYVE